MFPFTQSDKGLTVFIDGIPRTFLSSHPSYSGIIEAITNDDESKLRELADIRTNIQTKTLGRVVIHDDHITVAGREVSGKLVDRILAMAALGDSAINGYITFLDKLMDNPSSSAFNELYLFMESCDLPITPNGNFLAYKYVREDYKDCHTGTVDNSIGANPSMPRNMVCDKRDKTCAEGLHFCSKSYLSSSGHAHLMILEINPANVVCIPSDYNNSKGRCCEYMVIGEVEGGSICNNNELTPYFTDEYPTHEVSEEVESPAINETLQTPKPKPKATHKAVSKPKAKAPVKATKTPGRVGLSAKLSNKDVRKIFKMAKSGEYTLQSIAIQFDVHRRTVGRIRDREIFADINCRTTDPD